MSKSVTGSKKIKYYIAYDLNKHIFHVNNIDDGETCTTGLPNVEKFKTKPEIEKRIKELTGDRYYLKKNNINIT